MVAGFRVSTANRQQCLDQIMSWIAADAMSKYFACANPHSIECARKDPLFETALKEADLLVPDGIGVVWASRLAGIPIKERVTGADIFLGLSTILNQSENHSYFFLGSSEATLRRIADRMKEDYPAIRIAGLYSPPFAEEFSEAQNQSMIEAVNRARPDVLWIGLTAPKQEKWIHRHKQKLDVKFIGAIGAVFDFYAGTVRRSSPWFQDHGLEWLPRLIAEPRRLWKRMFISAPRFALRAIGFSIRNAVGRAVRRRSW